jgi:hypothetical protein
MAINYTTLRTEVETDPNNYGFAPLRANGDDTQITALLNLVRANISIAKTYMSFADLMNAMVPALSSVSTAQAGQLQLLGLSGQVKIGDANTQAYLEGVYTTTANKALLRAQYTRTGSRAEQLFGENTVLSIDDIIQARGVGW